MLEIQLYDHFGKPLIRETMLFQPPEPDGSMMSHRLDSLTHNYWFWDCRMQIQALEYDSWLLGSVQWSDATGQPLGKGMRPVFIRHAKDADPIPTCVTHHQVWVPNGYSGKDRDNSRGVPDYTIEMWHATYRGCGF